MPNIFNIRIIWKVENHLPDRICGDTMKKKYMAVILSAVMLIGVTGCGDDNEKHSENGNKINIETEGNNTQDTTDTQDDATSESDTSDTNSSDTKDILEDADVVRKIAEMEAYIDTYFYFDTDKETQEEAIYDGIMSGLDDPYSVYYTKEEYEDLMEEDSGEYCGIGAVVTQDANMLVTVVRPIKGSPAEEVGVMADDVFVEIDGVAITDQELTVVVDMIRGEEGTTAHVKFFRPSINDYIELDIPRRIVQNTTVNYEMLENNAGYIQVEQFYDNTDEMFIEAIEDLKNQGAKGFVIDLRDNPGGLLDSVVNMCEYVMPKGNIVTTKDKNGDIMKEYNAVDDDELDMPMVVLVNGNSASASEIFTGAMKDTGKAIIVGTKTFGKGIVQSVIPLSDGTAIKITVAKYFTPAGNDIHQLGIEPDYVVELADGRTNAVNILYEDDLQLQKAEELLAKMIK